MSDLYDISARRNAFKNKNRPPSADSSLGPSLRLWGPKREKVKNLNIWSSKFYMISAKNQKTIDPYPPQYWVKISIFKVKIKFLFNKKIILTFRIFLGKFPIGKNWKFRKILIFAINDKKLAKMIYLSVFSLKNRSKIYFYHNTEVSEANRIFPSTAMFKNKILVQARCPTFEFQIFINI